MLDLAGTILQAEREYAGTGGMVAWVPPRQLAERLALGRGEKPEDIHLTLAFVPDAAQYIGGMAAAMERVSLAFGPLPGEISGVGRFSIDDGDAVVALADVPGLSRLREALVWELTEHGVPWAQDHGFTAHMTLAYIPVTQKHMPIERLERTPITIGSLTLFGPDGRVGELALGGMIGARAASDDNRAGPFEDDRLDAEKRLAASVEKALQRIFKRLIAKLRTEARQKQITDIPDDELFWGVAADDFNKAVPLTDLTAVLGQGVAQAGRLGLGVDFVLANQGVLDYAQRYQDSWWGGLAATTRDDLRFAITDHIQSGEAMPDLISRLEPTFGRARAELIASTEVTRLFAEGNRQGYAAAGIETVEWRTVRDALVDDDCDALDEKRWPLGEEDEVPPLHPRCRCWIAPITSADTALLNRAEEASIELGSRTEEIEQTFDSLPTEMQEVLGNISRITDVPEADIVGELGKAAGYYRSETRTIFLSPEAADPVGNSVHELSHVLATSNPNHLAVQTVRSRWEELIRQGPVGVGRGGAVSEYATTSFDEYFSETLRSYFTRPSLLEWADKGLLRSLRDIWPGFEDVVHKAR